MPRPAQATSLIGVLSVLALLAATPAANAAPSCLEPGSAATCVPPLEPQHYYADLRSTIDQALEQLDEVAGFAFYCVSTGPRIGIEEGKVWCGERRII